MAPTVIAFIPLDGITGVGINSDIILTFSVQVLKGAGLIEILSGSPTGLVVASYDAATSANISISGRQLVINPTADLVYDTHYFVTLSDGSVKDVDGNAYAGTSSYDFTTVAAPDTTPPAVSTFSPATSASGVAISSDIVFTFSEAVQRGAGLIEIHSGSAIGPLVASYDVATSTNLTISGSTLTINPTSDLANGIHYFVTLSNGSIKDLASNNYAGISAYDFTTVMPPDFSPVSNNSGGVTEVALAGVGVLGFLAWVVF